MRSATASSCCSRATSRRCASDSDRSPARLEEAPRALRRRCATGSATHAGRAVERDGARGGRRAAVVPRRDRRRRPSGRSGAGDPRQLRAWRRASDGARAALDDYADWLDRAAAERATTTSRWAASDYDELVALRAFDGLTHRRHPGRSASEQLAANHDGRARRLAAEIDPERDEAEVLDRVKEDHPADFEEALDGLPRRDGPGARTSSWTHDIATLPAERAARGHRRRPSTCATSCPSRRTSQPAKFDRPPAAGIYIVTPSVDDDPRRDARAQLGVDLQHQHPRGLPGPPPAALGRARAPEPHPAAGRRARVRRGLGRCTASR